MAFGERILGSNRALISSNSVSGHATRILKIADQRLGPKSRSVQLKMPKFASQRPHHAPRSAGNTRLFSYRGHGLQRRYCLAGHVGLELKNVGKNYPFESSHGFPVIKPNSGHRDYSRLSCGGGESRISRAGARMAMAAGKRHLTCFRPHLQSVPYARVHPREAYVYACGERNRRSIRRKRTRL
jgi:hypothetical protein